jgi:hypothetical protein
MRTSWCSSASKCLDDMEWEEKNTTRPTKTSGRRTKPGVVNPIDQPEWVGPVRVVSVRGWLLGLSCWWSVFRAKLTAAEWVDCKRRGRRPGCHERVAGDRIEPSQSRSGPTTMSLGGARSSWSQRHLPGCGFSQGVVDVRGGLAGILGDFADHRDFARRTRSRRSQWPDRAWSW